jgi:hypothetical protein
LPANAIFDPSGLDGRIGSRFATKRGVTMTARASVWEDRSDRPPLA